MSNSKDYFKTCMELVLSPDIGAADSEDGNNFADKQLLVAAQCSMALKLHKASEKGRHGWWDNSVCTVEELYSMRETALEDNDHVGVLNFTAMIAMRESVESNKE